MLPRMELRHLRYFVAVAAEENVSRAALKLHVSQPGLSRQIRDLEAELGVALFERAAKSVRLTAAGRVFLREASAVLQRADDAIKAVRAATRSELHIGYAPSLTARILPPALRAFQSAVPDVRVKLHDVSTEEILRGLRDGKLQIAFAVRPTPGMLRGLQFEEMLRDPLRVAVALNHPLARRRSAALADIVREPLVAYTRTDYPEYHELLQHTFASLKARPRIAEEHDSVSSLIAAVESGAGVAIVPKSIDCTSGPRLKLLPLSPAPPPLVIGAAWLKLTASAEQFLKCARDAAATLK
jgi:DNA-binding transcriptional LysR family regulator